MSDTDPPQESPGEAYVRARDEGLVRHLRRYLNQSGFGNEEAERLLRAVRWELEAKRAGEGESRRRRHDVAFAATPIIVEPLRGLMDEWQLGEYRAYCYEAIMAALEAYDRAIAQEQRRLYPNQCPPSVN